MAKVLCMEVGRNIVRLAEVEKNGSSVTISKVHAFDTPEDATKDGKLRLSTEVVNSIREGIIDSEITAKDVYFVVESSKILYKQTTIPYTNKKNIMGALELSFSDLFPVDESLYHISYVLTNDKLMVDDKRLMALEVFAIPNEISQSYYDLAVTLGLNAKSLSDTTHSLKTLFNESFQNRTVAAINIGEVTSSVIISVDNEMVFNKTLGVGVSNAIATVANSQLDNSENIGDTNALQLLYTQNILLREIPDSLNDDSQYAKLRYDATRALIQTIKTILATFIQELSRQNLQLDECTISGIGAGIAGLTQLLGHEFGITVTTIQSGSKLKVTNNVAAHPLLLSMYPAAGSVLDATNFFTSSEKAGGAAAQRHKMDKIFLIGSIVVSIAALGYGGYTFINANMAKDDANKKAKELSNSIANLTSLGVQAAYDEYMNAMSYKQEIDNLYNETKTGNEDMTFFLDELEKITPQGCVVTSLRLTTDIAQVDFLAQDDIIAAGVIHKLRNMDGINSFSCDGVGYTDEALSATGEPLCSFSVRFGLQSAAERNGLVDEFGNPIEGEPEDVVIESSKPIIIDGPMDLDPGTLVGYSISSNYGTITFKPDNNINKVVAYTFDLTPIEALRAVPEGYKIVPSVKPASDGEIAHANQSVYGLAVDSYFMTISSMATDEAFAPFEALGDDYTTPQLFATMGITLENEDLVTREEARYAMRWLLENLTPDRFANMTESQISESINEYLEGVEITPEIILTGYTIVDNNGNVLGQLTKSEIDALERIEEDYEDEFVEDFEEFDSEEEY